ncbi:uncharacterized protein LOC133833180 [Humulus lupulus]|uniref:uncharacterized protein LOC133833180 n=1 Tax=Humulus lupulus TaxID=3486 RepID=UPI002B40796B|nr:uncharacterized protein LOC133833180 [Humulus lupulus]
MATPNIFDLYQIQEEEEVPLVRRKSAKRHNDESSQGPLAKKRRTDDPSKDGPTGQASAQPSAPAEKEAAPAANPSPAAMLTITAARTRAFATIEHARVKAVEEFQVKAIEELQAVEARHAGELEVVTQQKDALVAKLAWTEASQTALKKQKDDFQESSRIQYREVKRLKEELLAKDKTIAVFESQVEQLKLTNAKDLEKYKNETLRFFYDFWKHNRSANFNYLPEDARNAELACCTARLAAEEERARVLASLSIQPAASAGEGGVVEDAANQNAEIPRVP